MKKTLIKIAFVIVILILPIIIGFIVSTPICPELAVSNDWIGFWGSYAGAIIGSIITLIVMYKTLSINDKLQKKQRKQEASNRIAGLIASFCIEMMAYRSKWNTLHRKADGKEIDSFLKIELGATTEAARRIYFEIDILIRDVPEAENLLHEMEQILNAKITEKSVRETEQIMDHLRDEAREFLRVYNFTII